MAVTHKEVEGLYQTLNWAPGAYVAARCDDSVWSGLRKSWADVTCARCRELKRRDDYRRLWSMYCDWIDREYGHARGPSDPGPWKSGEHYYAVAQAALDGDREMIQEMMKIRPVSKAERRVSVWYRLSLDDSL